MVSKRVLVHWELRAISSRNKDGLPIITNTRNVGYDHIRSAREPATWLDPSLITRNQNSWPRNFVSKLLVMVIAVASANERVYGSRNEACY